MWELEQKKEKAEKEKRELANKKKKKEKEFCKAMYAAWGTGSDNDDDTKDVALMAMEDSELDSESDTEKIEVNLLDLKEKLKLFSKKKLFSLMITLIDNFQDLNENRDQLLSSLTNLKFKYIDLENINSCMKKENQFLKEQVQQLDSYTLARKSEILKQSVTAG